MLESSLSELSEICKIITAGRLRQEIFTGVKSVILVLKLGETCVSGDSLQENVAQSKIFVEMLAQHIN